MKNINLQYLEFARQITAEFTKIKVDSLNDRIKELERENKTLRNLNKKLLKKL